MEFYETFITKRWHLKKTLNSVFFIIYRLYFVRPDFLGDLLTLLNLHKIYDKLYTKAFFINKIYIIWRILKIYLFGIL